jgi:hypothetical protein
VQVALLLFHLQPLTIIAVQWMDFAKRFHRQEEHQFEVRHATRERSAF